MASEPPAHLECRRTLRSALWKSIATDTNNVSPRLGFAWSPFAQKHTVVRGGFGFFYDRVALRPLANALLSGGNTTNVAQIQLLSTTLNFGQTGAPVSPKILASAPSGLPVSFSTMDPHMPNAYSEQASLEIEQQLGSHGTLSASYQHLRGVHYHCRLSHPCARSWRSILSAVLSESRLSKTTTILPGSRFPVRRPIGFLRIPASSAGEPSASPTPDSKALDDVKPVFSAPLNNFNIHQDPGRSDDDQRHRLVFDVTLHTSTDRAITAWQRISNGFQLNGILTYYSALPFNIVTGANTIQTTAGRPCPGLAGNASACTSNVGLMIGRNSGTGFDSFSLNTRLSRTFAIGERFRLEAIAELFNTLNHANYQIPNNSFGTGVYPTSPSSTFGQPTAAQPAGRRTGTARELLRPGYQARCLYDPRTSR